MITSSFILGIFASMLHVISGPDHIAAVTPLVIETKSKVWKIGFSWGVGHLSGMLLIGFLFLMFKNLIPVDEISAYSEQLVGIVLILIGIWAFYKYFNDTEHAHPHIHKDNKPYIHIHKHSHLSEKHHTHTHSKIVKQNVFSAFGVGVVHGLAGISHFLLLLPVLSFTSNMEGAEYILGFGIGTVTAMTAYAFLLGRLVGVYNSNKKIVKGIRLLGGTFAIVVGIYWVFNSSIV